MINLYPFQQTAKQRVYEARQTGAKAILLQLPTGAGKTVVSADIIREHPGAAVAIAHRQEIVVQISLALARNNLRHKIIGPPAVARSCTNQHLAELGRNYVDPSNKLAVAGVDTLIRMRAEPWFNQVTMIFQDECFMAGTMVDGKPIENIKVGDRVTAFDEKAMSFYKKKVVKVYKNPLPENMVCVTIGRHVIKCTKNHPFYTKRGWLPESAKDP